MCDDLHELSDGMRYLGTCWLCGRRCLRRPMGLRGEGCWSCTVRVFDRNPRSNATIEDAIEFHTFASLEASMRATNGIPLGCSLFLPVGTVNSVQTLKDDFKKCCSCIEQTAQMFDKDLDIPCEVVG
jgi:hypothetical protein